MGFVKFYEGIRKFVGFGGVLALCVSVFAWLVIMGYHALVLYPSFYHVFSFVFIDVMCFVGVIELMYISKEKRK